MQLRSRRCSLLSPAEAKQTLYERQSSQPDKQAAAKQAGASSSPNAEPAPAAHPDTAEAAPQQDSTDVRDSTSVSPPVQLTTTVPFVQKAAAASDSQRPQRCHIVLSSASTAVKRPPSPAIVLSATVGPQTAACRSSSRLRKASKAKVLLATAPAAGANSVAHTHKSGDAHVSLTHGQHVQVSSFVSRSDAS